MLHSTWKETDKKKRFLSDSQERQSCQHFPLSRLFSKQKIESSFHNAKLNVKIMVSRALGATRIPTLNTLLTGTHLPGERSKPHFVRRQYPAAEFSTPLNPTDKFTSCPKHTTLLGIQALQCLLFHESQIIHVFPFSLLPSFSLSPSFILSLTHTHTHTHTHTEYIHNLLSLKGYFWVSSKLLHTGHKRSPHSPFLHTSVLLFLLKEELLLSRLLPRILPKPFLF